VKRLGPYLFIPLTIFSCALWVARAQAADLPRVDFNAAAAGPRQVEDTTEKAVARDYSRAWNSMITALSENRADVLDADFVGVALDNLRERISQQQQSGLHTRYIDRGHKLEAIFYSPEGSAIQLRDTAQFQVQFLDGSNVVHEEQRTENYTVVMTAAANRWKVRVLQSSIGQ
jgi:hypothetical protein